MSLNSCLFAAHLTGTGGPEMLRDRLIGLKRFYEPLGGANATWEFLPALRLLLGAIRFDHAHAQLENPLIWGGPVPVGLRDAPSLLDATDHELRQLEGVVALIASAPDRACVIAGAGGLTTLYVAESPDAKVWATHAAAAGWIAQGEAKIDSRVLPELLAMEYVGGDRTVIEDVRTVPPATRVAISAEGASSRSYWPAGERWELVREEDAYDQAEQELLASLKRRLQGFRPVLGLTGGLDSSVVAAALTELGQDVNAFTWGEVGWPDTLAAARTAELLAIPHRRQDINWQAEDGAFRGIDSEVRWSEGVAPVGLASRTWPQAVSVYLNGMGGETGRGFYYSKARTLEMPTPSVTELSRFFDFTGRLAGASREALRELRRSTDAWIEGAAEIGHDGWRCLDIVYAEQRVRRWGRAMVPRLDAVFMPAFSTPRIGRALASLPLADRVTGGFHRRFLSRIPEFPLPPIQEGGGPTWISHARRRAGAVPGARFLAATARSLRPVRVDGLWFAYPRWEHYPRLRGWLAEDVLGSPLLIEPLGKRWARRTRNAFLQNDSRATNTALLAAAPVALNEALRDLTSSR